MLVYTVPGSGEYVRDFPMIAANAGGRTFASFAAASGWYCPAYTWNVPVGSDTRARHIGWPSVPTFSTSVSTPTTNRRFTRAPSGVTTYVGARSPPPPTSKLLSLYSPANRRHATSRITSALQFLEHRARLLLDVHLEDPRAVHNHHEPVVVARHVPAHLDGLGDEQVRELVPDDLLVHRLLRMGDALLQGLLEQLLSELPPEHGGDRPGAVVDDALDAEVRVS